MARYGAVDIGSNSIRMQVVELPEGEPARILAEDREVTRLGESAFRQGRVEEAAITLTESVLARMAKTMLAKKVDAFRAVATSAIRDCRNQDEFLARASAVLGARVEIISGQEEARLIHLGVMSRWPDDSRQILIIDIGGGSAELIRGDKGRMAEAYSKPVGAVRLTGMFFHHDPPTERELLQFEEYVDEKLAPIRERWKGFRPDRVMATAATAAAVVRAVYGAPSSDRDAVDGREASRAQVVDLFRQLAGRNLAQRRDMPGIGSRRAEIIVAGCGVLGRVLETFSLTSLHYCAAGVRDGIIADLAARAAETEGARLSEDQRGVVRELARRCEVSLQHVDCVARMANRLFDELSGLHQLPPTFGRMLEAAAYLHDIGHFVSDTRHHWHSYYLVLHSGLPGFTDRERIFVANLCRYHRRSLPRLKQENFKALTGPEKKALLKLIPLLRIADSLDRSHEQRVEEISARVDGEVVELAIRGSRGADLEEWAVLQNRESFAEVYGKSLRTSREK